MKNPFQLFISLLISVASFGQPRNTPPAKTGKGSQIDTPTFTILPLSKAYVFDKTYTKATITKSEIETINKLIRDKLKKVGYSNYQFEEYKKQFVAAIDKRGNKVVFVNAFCGTYDNWRTEFIDVLDGGTCVFQTTINLRSKKIISFSFNGEA